MAPDDHDPGYVRGAAGGPASSRQVGTALLLAGMASAGVLSVVLGFGAVHQDQRLADLRDHGVPVQVSVTSCVGVLSGTGITEAGYQCEGSFALSGRTYQEVIQGTATNHPTGEQLAALVLPGKPESLTTADAVGHRVVRWEAYAGSAVSLVVLVVLGVVLRRVRRADR